MHRIIQRCAWELSVCSMVRLPAVVMLRGGEPDEKIAKNVRLDIEKVREASCMGRERMNLSHTKSPWRYGRRSHYERRKYP